MRLFILQFLLFSFLSVSAQTTVEATYSVTSLGRQQAVEKAKSKKENQQYGDILEMMVSGTTTDYRLVSDGTTSSFTKVTKEDQLENDAPKIVILSNDYADEETSYYKHFSSHKMTEAIDFLMKTYIISDTLGNLSWKLHNEEKEILGQKCYRATLGDSITAWYCMNIPISDGPGPYHGLPGLILDVEAPEAVYRCQSIITPSEAKIEREKKGKSMSKKDFEAFKKKTFNTINDRR